MNIQLQDYPQLRLIAWNLPQGASVDAEKALSLYERNWRFVEVAQLGERETQLIEHLRITVGNGVLNV
jgi:hypothetical protein